MVEDRGIRQTIHGSLIESAKCHVFVCQDSNKVYEKALHYVKKIRKEVIREVRDKKRGFWSIHLSNGYQFIFCSSEYFKSENLQYSRLAFSK